MINSVEETGWMLLVAALITEQIIMLIVTSSSRLKSFSTKSRAGGRLGLETGNTNVSSLDGALLLGQDTEGGGSAIGS